MSYVTLPDFRAYLRNEMAGVDDVDLQEALDSASEAINDHCARSFTVAGAASARLYVPSDEEVLFIDDATTVTAVSVNGVALASTEYQKEPLNGILNGQSVPYTRLVRLGGYEWEPDIVDERKAIISVTATWGWSAVPSRVLTACKILAKEIAEARNQVGGYVDLGEVAARAVSHPKYGQMLYRLQRVDRTVGIA